MYMSLKINLKPNPVTYSKTKTEGDILYSQIYQSLSTLVALILNYFIWIQHDFQAITYNIYDYIKMSQ